MGCITCGCRDAELSELDGYCNNCGEVFVDDKIWYADKNNELQRR